MRSAHVLITYRHLKLLRAWADIHGAGGAGAAETTLEAILDDWISTKPELIDRVKREEAALKQSHAEWAVHWKQPSEDEIP